jgi:3-hydroxybutyryl-CoA dehydrogenase
MAEIKTEPIENYGLSKKKLKRTLFSRIGVVGCGREGSYIATVAAIHGIEVVFMEPSEEKIKNAFGRIESKLDKKIESWGLTSSDKKAILSRVTGTSEYKDFAGCDFVIEAIRYDDNTGIRSVDGRKEVFQQLENVLDEKAIIASNVSTIIVTELANELKHNDRCIGVHFLANIPDNNILEIVPCVNTSKETFDKLCQFAKLINHQYVKVQESSGLVSLRLFFIQLNEACAMLMEGVCSVEDIDKVLTVGFGHHQGVFQTADRMGIEKIVHLMENMFEEYGNIKYKPSPVLKNLYRAKHFGIKHQKGFYKYDENENIVESNHLQSSF